MKTNFHSVISIDDLRDEIKERLMFKRFIKTAMPIIMIMGVVIAIVLGKLRGFETRILIEIFFAGIFLTVGISLFLSNKLPNKPASRMAKKFFLEKLNIAIQSFCKDLKIAYSSEHFQNLFSYEENDKFAIFSLNILIFDFDWGIKDLQLLKGENGLTIIIEEIELTEETIDSKKRDIFIISYRQFKSEEGIVGQNCQKMEYRVPV